LNYFEVPKPSTLICAGNCYCIVREGLKIFNLALEGSSTPRFRNSFENSQNLSLSDHFPSGMKELGFQNISYFKLRHRRVKDVNSGEGVGDATTFGRNFVDFLNVGFSDDFRRLCRIFLSNVHQFVGSHAPIGIYTPPPLHFDPYLRKSNAFSKSVMAVNSKLLRIYENINGNGRVWPWVRNVGRGICD
jgi:hypothetical protein